jgi:hypothetical protein
MSPVAIVLVELGRAAAAAGPEIARWVADWIAELQRTRPELIQPGDAAAPPPAAAARDKVDADIDAAIERGDL